MGEIAKLDLSGKVVWSWGAGLGDAWLAQRCKHLHVVERDTQWLMKSADVLAANQIANVTYYSRPCNEGSGADEMYCEIPEGVVPEVIIVDDVYRYECIVKALTMPRPLLLIVDNWWQDFVFICPAAKEALQEFEQKIFSQPDHTNHEGNEWKTALFYIK